MRPFHFTTGSAATEDANRAIEQKNGSSIGGRTIGVKQATHRAPLEQRRSKGNEVVPSNDTIKAKDDEDDKTFSTNDIIKTKDGKDDSVFHSDDITMTKDEKDDSSTPIVKHKLAPDSQEKVTALSPCLFLVIEGQSKWLFDAARDNKVSLIMVARTVVIGEILNDDIAEDVHRHARECRSVSSITYPLPKEDIAHHGLLQDGCRLGASSIVYTSVKSARSCVAKLHQKTLRGGTVWARQLGGEGSKANVSEIREMFSAAGFVWDVFIPKNLIQAIQKFNRKIFGKRPIVVDWAVPKKIYTAGSQVTMKDGQKESDEENSSSDLEDDLVELDKNTQHSHGAAVVPDGSDSTEEEVNFDEEANVAKKVLNNFLSSLNGPTASVNDDVFLPQRKQDDKTINVHNKISDGPTTVPHVSKPESLTKTENTNFKSAESEEDLQRTLFICNLPFDVTIEEVKQRFSGFGEVQSFVPVLHPITKRPRGTGILKFITMDAVDAAFSAATTVTDLGIILKGRQLKVLNALNKKATHDKEVKKTKKEEHDHRNLYLAKEGVIIEGTPAAQGVSDSDMSKRRS
ncbi:hypothetical protein L6452_36053 [Arctium lappa]|uniref:Uncharacterized protein n=1 Tax=Arctium lappa TaxID=4217 RepID=A0ACB8YCB8_ARCLA|nr:hypothetical protein L6452_36053 [Arctium lappa]